MVVEDARPSIERIAWTVRSILRTDPAARIVLEGRAAEVTPLVEQLRPHVVDIATPDLDADLPLVLRAGLQAHDARWGKPPGEGRRTIRVTRAGDVLYPAD